MAEVPVALRLPADHPQRIELNDEVHARPPQALAAPLRLTYLALVADSALRERQWQQVIDLVRRYGVEPPPEGTTHFSADLGPFRLKWERHTEFSRYKFMVPGSGGADPFASPALAAVPQDWLGGLVGEVMVATHAALLPASSFAGDYDALALRLFGGNTLVGAAIAGGAATAFTDFRIRPDRFGRLLVLDRNMTPRQAGRMVQRLVEIDTYRIMALLAFPVARALAPAITRSERELAEITTALAAATVADETALLDRLTRLEAEIEGRQADTHYRFGAANAYWSLVDRRIAELREERLPGLQTFREFTERRLAPAIDTCRAVAARQESLSQRGVARDPAAIHPGRPHPRAAEPGDPRIDGSARPAAAAAAGDGRGPLRRGDHLLHRRAGRLSRQGIEGRRCPRRSGNHHGDRHPGDRRTGRARHSPGAPDRDQGRIASGRSDWPLCPT
jgi:uncharacterized membrane-anchored protein